MRMMTKLFVDHPATVGETYFEHLRVASTFGARMLLGGFACLVHGLVPCLFQKTGSTQIRYLHDKMVANRTAAVMHSEPAYRGVDHRLS